METSTCHAESTAVTPTPESVVCQFDRPSLLVKQDRVLDEKTGSNFSAEAIRKVCRAVGRIERSDKTYFGTGFLLRFKGEVYMATCEHVAEHINKNDYLNFDREADDPAITPANFTARILDKNYAVLTGSTTGHHDGEPVVRPDIALFNIGYDATQPVFQDRQPLELDDTAEQLGDKIFLVGYPGSCEDNSPVEPWGEYMFKSHDKTCVKRFSYGEIMERSSDCCPDQGKHDATTTGGSSGSPVVRVKGDTPLVVGVHYSGSPHKANYYWKLRASLTRVCGVDALSGAWFSESRYWSVGLVPRSSVQMWSLNALCWFETFARFENVPSGTYKAAFRLYCNAMQRGFSDVNKINAVAVVSAPGEPGYDLTLKYPHSLQKNYRIELGHPQSGIPDRTDGFLIYELPKFQVKKDKSNVKFGIENHDDYSWKKALGIVSAFLIKLSDSVN